MDGKKRKLLIFDLLLMAVLVAADQFTKYLAVIKLKDQPSFDIIGGVLEFSYLTDICFRDAAKSENFFCVCSGSVFVCNCVCAAESSQSE